MKINKKIKTFEEYKEDINDIFSEEEVEKSKKVQDVEKSKEVQEEEEKKEEEKELEKEEEEKVWGDENMVERFKTFESNKKN